MLVILGINFDFSKRRGLDELGGLLLQLLGGLLGLVRWPINLNLVVVSEGDMNLCELGADLLDAGTLLADDVLVQP